MTPTPTIHAFFDPATWTVSYVVYETDGSPCAIIDPVLDYDPKSGRTSTTSADRIVDFIQAHQLSVAWILETHAHADHLSAAPYIQARVGGKIGIDATNKIGAETSREWGRVMKMDAPIVQAVDARSKDRLKFLTNTLQSRKQQEVADIGTVLDELERAIQAELKKDQQPAQLSLFTEDERTQLRRDTAALEARLARIPAERQQEAEAIEARYAKLNDRTFPVAVIFLVPASAAQGGAA